MKDSLKKSLIILGIFICYGLLVYGASELLFYLEAQTGIDYLEKYEYAFFYTITAFFMIGMAEWILKKSYQLWQQYWRAE